MERLLGFVGFLALGRSGVVEELNTDVDLGVGVGVEGMDREMSPDTDEERERCSLSGTGVVGTVSSNELDEGRAFPLDFLFLYFSVRPS
jgi:hypothetical protein